MRNSFNTPALALWALAAVILPQQIGAIPVVGPEETTDCKNPPIRKEWRRLTIDERISYLDAVECMMGKPARTSTDDAPGVSNLWEDFLASHIAQTMDVHFNGIFYAYHRFLLHHYEAELHSCGLPRHIGQPYWDPSLDSSNPNISSSGELASQSPVFHPEHGFGGNGAWVPGNHTHPAPGMTVHTPWDIPGRSGGGCIPDGRFAGLRTGLGPGEDLGGGDGDGEEGDGDGEGKEKKDNNNKYCVNRDLAWSTLVNYTLPRHYAEAMEEDTYDGFNLLTQYGVHAGGHQAVGGLYGSMSDAWASAADPLFYLHHANLDRAWWSWQSRDLPARLSDVTGCLAWEDYGNEVAGNVTLDTVVWWGLLGEGEGARYETTIGEMTDIRGGGGRGGGLGLCYGYDVLY